MPFDSTFRTGRHKKRNVYFGVNAEDPDQDYDVCRADSSAAGDVIVAALNEYYTGVYPDAIIQDMRLKKEEVY